MSGNGATHQGLGSPTLITIKTIPHRHAPRSTWSRQFLTWNFLPKGFQVVSRWYLKLTVVRANTSLLFLRNRKVSQRWEPTPWPALNSCQGQNQLWFQPGTFLSPFCCQRGSHTHYCCYSAFDCLFSVRSFPPSYSPMHSVCLLTLRSS